MPAPGRGSALLRDGLAHVDAAFGGSDYTALTCGRFVESFYYMGGFGGDMSAR